MSATDGPGSTAGQTAPAASTPGPVAPEWEVARDLARRGLLVGPPIVAVAWLVSGRPEALSIGYGIAVVCVNLIISAYLLRWAARISIGLLPSVSLGGYAVRLALVFLAVWSVKDMAWVRLVPLGMSIIVAHLGLLVWELRYVSATYAHPGLKPKTHRPAAGYRSQWLENRNRASGAGTRSRERQSRPPAQPVNPTSESNR